MGRVKLVIEKIENPTACQITYSKRRNGLVKKAAELSVLCGIDIGVLMFSPAGRMSSYAANGRVEDVFLRYFNIPAKLRGGPITDEENIIQRLIRMKIDGELTDQISKRETLRKELVMVKEKVNEAKTKLRFYMPDVQNIRTLTQAELHERIVLIALKHLEIVRENLIYKMNFPQQFETIKVPSKEIEDVDNMLLHYMELQQGFPRRDESKKKEMTESSGLKANGTITAVAPTAAEKGKMVIEAI